MDKNTFKLIDIVEKKTLLTFKFEGDNSYGHFKPIGGGYDGENEFLLIVDKDDFIDDKQLFYQIENDITSDSDDYESEEDFIKTNIVDDVMVQSLNYKNLLKYFVGEIEDDHLYFDLTNATQKEIGYNFI